MNPVDWSAVAAVLAWVAICVLPIGIKAVMVAIGQRTRTSDLELEEPDPEQMTAAEVYADQQFRGLIT